MKLLPANAPLQPTSLSDLFITFTLLALQGFGGVLAIVQRELVDKKRWLTQEEFLEDWAVAQIMPGPNVVNLSLMIGARHFGLPGALAAVAGMLVMPLIVVLLLALLYAQYAGDARVDGALRGMSAVAAGLIAGSALKLLRSLQSNPMGPISCALLGLLCVLAMTVWHWPLVYVLLLLGSMGWLICYVKLQA